MDRKAVFLFLALFLSHAATAHADKVKDTLKQKYQNQLLALRSPLTGRTQKFDSAGQPVNPPSAGEWLFYGGIYVEKLDVSNDKLSLEGPQVAPTDKKKKGKPVFVPIGKPVKWRSTWINLLSPPTRRRPSWIVFFFWERTPFSTPNPSTGVPTTPVQPGLYIPLEKKDSNSLSPSIRRTLPSAKKREEQNIRAPQY